MCNFIMIMILLVTAYSGIAKKGRREGATHGYSKYSRRPRVRTAFRLASLPSSPSCPVDGRAIWKQLVERSAGSSRGLP